MPAPIRPHPSTPTFFISAISLSELEALADLVGDADERAAARCRQGPVAADLSLLEAVEHLLERDLGPPVGRAAPAPPDLRGIPSEGCLEGGGLRSYGEWSAAG